MIGSIIMEFKNILCNTSCLPPRASHLKLSTQHDALLYNEVCLLSDKNQRVFYARLRKTFDIFVCLRLDRSMMSCLMMTPACCRVQRVLRLIHDVWQRR